MIVLIETNQESIVPKLSNKCNEICDDVHVIDSKTCSCVKTVVNENHRNTRSLDRVLVSKLIRDDELVSQTSNQCSYNEYWNGNACISSISLCPGGYHWNGRACIIQSSIQTAALVPSEPDKKCKYAQQREEQASNIQLPDTVMPTISTSPMCPFGFIWSGSNCVRNPPICPSGYVYYGDICHRNTKWTTETTTETIAYAPTHETPSFYETINQNINNRNQGWQQPFYRTTEIILKVEPITENPMDDDNDEKRMTYDQNQQPCCSILSPRICRRISTKFSEQWQCFHYKYKRCGLFCTKPKVIIRPKKISFNEPLLIMPPPPPRLMKLMQNHAYRETNNGKMFNFLIEMTFFTCIVFYVIDCSGCINGSYGCSSECFAYQCNSSNCDFIDEDQLCENNNTDDGNNENEDYDSGIYNEICAYTSM